MAFEMKNMAYWKAKNGGSPAKQKVDPDAPGTPGKPGYEPPVNSMDYLTKTPVGPRATVKSRQFDEKEDATLERMENSTKFDGKSEMEINKAKKENAKKYTSDDEEQAYENAQNDFDTDNPTKAQLAKALKGIKAGN